MHPNQYALVVSTENITQNWYFGNVRSMLLPNTLFRMGCSATVLSNRYVDGWRAKYQLHCPVVRTMTGGMNDAAYNCIYQMEDDTGIKVRVCATMLSLLLLLLLTSVCLACCASLQPSILDRGCMQSVSVRCKASMRGSAVVAAAGCELGVR